jgi:prepilin-type N-terminal cleavage/methylation domain-containing protein
MRLPDHRPQAGLTLIEVMTAIALLTIVLGGLVYCGSAAMRMADLIRLTTEARGLAKMRMEELAGATRAQLAEASFAALRPATNLSTINYPVVVQTRLSWHLASGAGATAASNDYAEVFVDVLYDSPVTRRRQVNTLPGLIH